MLVMVRKKIYRINIIIFDGMILIVLVILVYNFEIFIFSDLSNKF